MLTATEKEVAIAAAKYWKPGYNPDAWYLIPLEDGIYKEIFGPDPEWLTTDPMFG